MLLIFCVLCIALITFSLMAYDKKKINPITLLIVPWLAMVIGYNMKFVLYYDLNVNTYIVVIIALGLFSFGTVLGANLHCVEIRFKYKEIIVNIEQYKKIFKKYIIFFSVVGSIPSVLALGNIVNRFGLTFYNQIATIYAQRINGQYIVERIPYVGSLLYIAIILAGIYVAKYGLTILVLLPIAGAIIQTFSYGTRQGLLEVILLFIIPVISSKFIKLQRKDKINQQKKKGKFGYVLLVISIVCFFIFVTNQRSSYVNSSVYSGSKYLSERFRAIVAKHPSLFQLYTYFTSPIGVLNEYLKKPTYSFGANTLFPFYNLFNKFGINIEVQRYQDFYNIPIHVNVGTVLRELIQDYTIVPAMVIVFILGISVGLSYVKYTDNQNIKNTFRYSMLTMLILLSVFMWFLRDANLIIALVVGLIVSERLDSYIIEVS